MPLSLDHAYDVCLLSDITGKCCRYLSEESSGMQYHCLKKSKFKKQIDEEVNANINPESNIPKGDNCPGFPIFQHLIVGYDQKNY